MPRYKYPRIATAFCLSAAFALSSCGNATGNAAGNAAVDAPETTAKPVGSANYAKDAAISSDKLAALVAPFFDDPAMAQTHAVVIMHGGTVVAERYAPGFDADTRLISWSMAKSVTATLVGLMVADGRLVLDDPAPVPQWHSPGDPRGKITLRHLLNMASGLDHQEGPDDAKGIPIQNADTTRMLFLDGRDNVARYAEGHTLDTPPGENFKYSTPTSHILIDIMTRVLTDSTDPEIRREAMRIYMKGRLFDPLGMHSAFAEFDRSGTMLGGSMIHATARDWAKFGEFLRNNGSVRSAQLLPTSWTQFMRTPSPTNSAYGGHLWLNRTGADGKKQVLFPGKGPRDVYAALGHLGQFVLVSPRNKLTVVRLGNTVDADLDGVDDQLAKVVAAF
jgi:CubicO group peptidase (beta-lactamase class C family)